MSDQQPAPQAAPPADAPVHGGTGPEASKLHDHALKAEKHLESLATGLSQVGGDAKAVKAVSQMADVCRQLASAMAKLAQQEQPPAPAAPAQQPQSMGSATDSMQQDLRAQRAQPNQ